LESRNLKNLTVLLLSKNSITNVVGPFKDLKEASEMTQKREIMKLQVLDLRENEITTLRHLVKAKNFLRKTLTFVGDNKIPAKRKEELKAEKITVNSGDALI
jgi:Leucine-rich repeat (LRR) protein